MSIQASDIAREAQEDLDRLMGGLARVFQDAAATMAVQPFGAKKNLSAPTLPALKI